MRFRARASRDAFVVIAAIVTSGCSPMPQTPAEFRTLVANHQRGHVERFEVAAPSSKVMADLERGLSHCVDGVTITRVGYQSGSRTTYHARALTDAEGGPGYAIQAEHGGIQTRSPPPGGYFLFLVDVARGRSPTTVVVSGGAVGIRRELYEALLRWARGGGPPCPELVD
jgi:hypothetical protein